MKEPKSVSNNHHHQQHQHANSHLSSSKFSRYFDPDASWDKDQLCDVLHWIRQVVALMLGLLCGAIPVVGGIWFISYFLISSSIVYVYYAMILKIDEEDFGGHGTLLQEGLVASTTVFLLTWILVYSLAHF